MFRTLLPSNLKHYKDVDIKQVAKEIKERLKNYEVVKKDRF